MYRFNYIFNTLSEPTKSYIIGKNYYPIIKEAFTRTRHMRNSDFALVHEIATLLHENKSSSIAKLLTARSKNAPYSTTVTRVRQRNDGNKVETPKVDNISQVLSDFRKDLEKYEHEMFVKRSTPNTRSKIPKQQKIDYSNFGSKVKRKEVGNYQVFNGKLEDIKVGSRILIDNGIERRYEVIGIEDGYYQLDSLSRPGSITWSTLKPVDIKDRDSTYIEILEESSKENKINKGEFGVSPRLLTFEQRDEYEMIYDELYSNAKDEARKYNRRPYGYAEGKGNLSEIVGVLYRLYQQALRFNEKPSAALLFFNDVFVAYQSYWSSSPLNVNFKAIFHISEYNALYGTINLSDGNTNVDTGLALHRLMDGNNPSTEITLVNWIEGMMDELIAYIWSVYRADLG